ncbi:MAG: McrB family protein [Candidatus Bruticola sp.]
MDFQSNVTNSLGSKPNATQKRPYWFVGAAFSRVNDKTVSFVENGIWQNDKTDQRTSSLVKSVKPGDRIAIKSTYVRKDREDLPFDNRGNSVSIMAIKAIGTVTKNNNDGKTLYVNWEKYYSTPREWFFYTCQQTIWEVSPENDWKAEALVRFAFKEEAQDIDRFRNAPYWFSRFGDSQAYAVAEKSASAVQPDESYSVDNIVDDGCFMAKEKIADILNNLEMKKNLILQGPPGTGKTWLAKRLAYALIGKRNSPNVRAVQFHANLSYEDFVRGLRPMGGGNLQLVDGIFIEMINEAISNPGLKYVLVIEEINRGNPANIFGEMLTLLESDKRRPEEALQLSYRHSKDERVYIPDNLYIIGTMNIADRSIAMLDLALRRRFAFIDLKPTLDDNWRNWVHYGFGIDLEILEKIKSRLITLNKVISEDPDLGPQCCVGHSYVTPSFSQQNIYDLSQEEDAKK